jgi:hypothetical protein
MTAGVLEQVAVEIRRPAAFCFGGRVGLQVADGEQQLPKFSVGEGGEGRAASFQFAQNRAHSRRVSQRIYLSRSSSHFENLLVSAQVLAFHDLYFSAGK